jgi:mRNA-degrading endonuclease toxin of MazEF toxin-antitoxin module
VAATLRGDVRLCRFPPPDKQRPVLVLTRASSIGYLTTVTVAPITSTVRGVPSEVILEIDDGMKSRCAVKSAQRSNHRADTARTPGRQFEPDAYGGGFARLYVCIGLLKGAGRALATLTPLATPSSDPPA